VSRGCLIIVLVVPLLSLSAAGVVLYKVNADYGLFQAPLVSHELLARENTRLRLAVKLDPLSDLLVGALPEESALPAWLPFDLDTMLPQVLPHELALLGGADYRTGGYELTVFVNERRGGPLLAQIVNESGVLDNLEQVTWDTRGMAFQARGTLTLDGVLPIPEDAETLILRHWTHDVPEAPLVLQGGHFLEAALDNRNGDVIALWATFAGLQEQDLPELLETDVNMKMLFDTLVQITSMHLWADLATHDELLIDLRVGAHPSMGPNLQLILGAFVLPEARHRLKTQYDVTLEGEANWDADEEVLKGQFRLRGFRPHVLDALGGARAGSAARGEAPGVPSN